MNEEIRKEFEGFWINYCANRGVNCNLARLINGEYASWPEHNAYVGWKASREAMKPIKLPKSEYAYHVAQHEMTAVIDLNECREAIKLAGYKVEE